MIDEKEMKQMGVALIGLGIVIGVVLVGVSVFLLRHIEISWK